MKKGTILILGFRSFAAKGLAEHLINAEYEVDCYSRGEEKIDDQVITGNVFDICSNKYFRQHYDFIINYIIIKNGGVDQNLKYIKVLSNFSHQKSTRRLYQISSISVYKNDIDYVNENSEIESDIKNKGVYASIKVAVDNYLLNLKNPGYKIIFLRPGFIISDSIPSTFAGISIKLPFNTCFLLGDKTSSLPLIQREILHVAIVGIIQAENNVPVYLLFENTGGTKYSYLKSRTSREILILPQSIIITLAKFLHVIGLLNKQKYKQIIGLFKSTKFDSSFTEKLLGIKF